jgi:hypothetical protein
MHVGGFDNVMMYGFAAACVLGPIAATSGPRWLRIAGPIVLLAQFTWLGCAAWQRQPSHTLLPSDAHRQAHEQLRAYVAAQPGPVWIPAHGWIAYREGKGTGAHGQAIFDLFQMLPKHADGGFDLAALADPARLAELPRRSREALDAFMTATDVALRERHFAAIVVDEEGTHAFAVVFAHSLAGPDGKPGTDDDPYVRLPGPILTEPDAIRPLLGFDVRRPYALVPR